MIKPIETEYKGYRFRSRLEARWAVFFDACGVNWEYEPEGFDLGDGIWYLPDFVVRNGYGEQWFEVKGILTDQDRFKILKFAMAGKNIMVVSDIPYGTTPRELYEEVRKKNKENDLVYALLFKDYDYGTGEISFSTQPALPMIVNKVFGIGYEPYLGLCDKKTVRAYKKARQARFEYGEHGGIEAGVW